MRQRRPDLDHPLHDEVEPAAEIALHGAGEDADHRRDAGEHQAEQHRDAKAVDEAGDDVVPVLIGAEPQRLELAAGPGDGRRVLDVLLLERGAALGIGQHPGRRRRQRRRRVEDRGRIGEADRRPDHPAMRLDLVGDERIAIVRARLEPAELVLRIIDEDGEQELALVGGDQRPVVGDELGERARRRTARERSRTTMRRACCGGNCRAAAGSSARASGRRSGSRGPSPAPMCRCSSSGMTLAGFSAACGRVPVRGARRSVSTKLTPRASRNRCGDRSRCR